MTNYMTNGFKITNSDGDDEVIQIPYNLNNVLATEQDIIKILEKFNIKVDKINKLEYFHEAFTHKSYCKKTIFPEDILIASKKELGNPPELVELRDNNFERLEWVGDKPLKLIVTTYLFHRYPNEDQGFLTRLQTKIEDKKNLPIFSKEMGLGKYFIISKHIESMNGRLNDKINEDIFESFIGALYLSNGFEVCCLLITNLLENYVDYSEKLYCDNNYKDLLLRFHHQKSWDHPRYVVIHHEGPPHKRKNIVAVCKQNIKENDSLKNKYISYGKGNSIKEGEQNAAKMALIIHGVLQEDQYIQNDIYYPPFDKIENGECNILNENEDDVKSVYSEKSC